MASDSTMDEIRRLGDPSQYAVKRGVPIWVPHTRTDADGEEIVVAPDDLADYAKFINEQETERGVLGRITDGHVKPDSVLPNGTVARFPAPKLLGYYRKARVGTFGPKNTPAVLVDCYYRRDCLDIARERPYRSVEVYAKAKQIRGLALLLNDPFLDMGTATYDRAERPVCYGGDHMPDAAMGPNNGAMPEKKDDEDDEEYSPEDKSLFEKCRRYMRKTYGLGEEWPGAAKKDDYQVGDGESKNQKGQIRAMHAKDPEERESDGSISSRLSREQQGQTPSLYQKQIASLNARLDGMALEREHERCQSLLYQLHAEGFRLADDDKADELKVLAAKPQADRPAYLNRLRKRYEYTKVPGAEPIHLYQGQHFEGGGTTDANDPTAKPWYHDAAMQYMLAKPGTQYDSACAYIQSTQAKK